MMKMIGHKLKKLLWERTMNLDMLRRHAINYCIHNELFPGMITGAPSTIVRKMLELPASEQQTQLNQDIFALLMNRFRTGFFLEIGANDGFTFSNTVYLEKEFGWHGILVEANQKYLESLKLRKNSLIVNKAVSTHHGEADFIDAGLYGGLKTGLDDTHYLHTKDAACIKVECMELQEILNMAAAPARIDFVSIDVEGGEMPIVEQLVTTDRRFGCGCIEYNGRSDDFSRMENLLENAGYRVVWKGLTGSDLFFVDTVLPPLSPD